MLNNVSKRHPEQTISLRSPAMETQDITVVHHPQKTGRKFPQLGSARSRNRAMRRCGGRQRTDGCDAMRSSQFLGIGLNPDIDRLMVGLRDLTSTSIPPQSIVHDEEVPDHPAVAEKIESCAHKA